MARLSSAALIAIAAALATGAALSQRRTSSEPPDWTGVYSAHFDGDAQGEMTIVRQRNADAPYRLSMNMRTERERRDWCTGQLAGSGGPVARGQMVFSIPNISRGGACHVTLTRGRTGVRVEEDDCLDFHGVSCAFDGTAYKRR